MNVFYIDVGQVMGSTYIIPSMAPMILTLTLAQFGKLADGLGVGNDFYFGLHVDLPTALVYVADMLRFCCRHGNFFVAVEYGKFDGKNFSRKIKCGIDNGADVFVLADTVHSSGLLLYVLALLIARVVNGVVPYELARKHRLHTRKHRRRTRDNNFVDRRIFAEKSFRRT